MAARRRSAEIGPTARGRAASGTKRVCVSSGLARRSVERGARRLILSGGIVPDGARFCRERNEARVGFERLVRFGRSEVLSANALK